MSARSARVQEVSFTFETADERTLDVRARVVLPSGYFAAGDPDDDSDCEILSCRREGVEVDPDQVMTFLWVTKTYVPVTSLLIERAWDEARDASVADQDLAAEARAEMRSERIDQ